MITYFDAVLLALIIGSGLWSAHRGLIRETFALLALVLGIVLATACYGLVMPYLARFVGPGIVARILAYVIIFAVAVLVTVVAGNVIQKVVKVLLLGWLDRCGGFVVGVLKAVVIIGMVALLADRIPAVHDALRTYSDLAPWLMRAARAAFHILPALFARFAYDFA